MAEQQQHNKSSKEIKEGPDPGFDGEKAEGTGINYVPNQSVQPSHHSLAATPAPLSFSGLIQRHSKLSSGNNPPIKNKITFPNIEEVVIDDDDDDDNVTKEEAHSSSSSNVSPSHLWKLVKGKTLGKFRIRRQSSPNSSPTPTNSSAVSMTQQQQHTIDLSIPRTTPKIETRAKTPPAVRTTLRPSCSTGKTPSAHERMKRDDWTSKASKSGFLTTMTTTSCPITKSTGCSRPSPPLLPPNPTTTMYRPWSNQQQASGYDQARGPSPDSSSSSGGGIHLEPLSAHQCHRRTESVGNDINFAPRAKPSGHNSPTSSSQSSVRSDPRESSLLFCCLQREMPPPPTPPLLRLRRIQESVEQPGGDPSVLK